MYDSPFCKPTFQEIGLDSQFHVKIVSQNRQTLELMEGSLNAIK